LYIIIIIQIDKHETLQTHKIMSEGLDGHFWDNKETDISSYFTDSLSLNEISVKTSTIPIIPTLPYSKKLHYYKTFEINKTNKATA